MNRSNSILTGGIIALTFLVTFGLFLSNIGIEDSGAAAEMEQMDFETGEDIELNCNPEIDKNHDNIPDNLHLIPIIERFEGPTDWSYCDFSNANLTGVDLSDKDMTGTILTGADLTNANLTGVDLSGKDLTGTILTGADLTNANLTETRSWQGHSAWRYNFLFELHERLVTIVPFDDIELIHLMYHVDDFYSNLTGIDLSSINLTNSILTSANLSGKDLTNANLTGVDLSGKDLTGTILINADFTDATLNCIGHSICA